MASSGDNPWGGSMEGKKTARLGGSAPTLTDRVGEKFSRTKDVAAVGYGKTKVAAKKVKDGASVGINWIKVKYSKSKLFQKK